MGDKKVNLDNLKEVRKDKGYSRKEIADKLGVTYNTYRNYEEGITTIPLPVAKKLADIFETKIETLFYSISYRVICGI